MKDEIFHRIQAAIGIRPLRNNADATTHLDSIVANVCACDSRCACRWPHAGGEYSYSSGLPRAVRPDHSEEFALANVEVERFEGDDIAARPDRARLSRRAKPRRTYTPFLRRYGINLPQAARFDDVDPLLRFQ
jgi:hypothetical protein